jgi:cellobiose phosphorylase
MRTMKNTLEYIGKNGVFRLYNPANIHELYFPLCNESGLMSCITPILHGDAKIDQDHFITQPVTVEDLHNTKSARNFWLNIKGKGPFSATGNSALQNSRYFTDRDKSERIVEAGPLWHKLIYKDPDYKILCETINFVPSNEDQVEIMHVSITNQDDQEIVFTPTSSIPLYCRSAENIRDHRHVTSLINRLERLEAGVTVKPLILFDERGHKYNDFIYYSLGTEGDGTLPSGAFPSVHDFIGEKGSFEWPEAVVRNLNPEAFKNKNVDGMEYVAALRFNDCILKPGEKKDYILIIGICNDKSVVNQVLDRYNTSEKIIEALNENKAFWEELSQRISFDSGLENFSSWMSWVSLQPVFRKIYGCSFLPYHDYGKGGRGWRDLWQDCLSLILQDPSNVRQLLIDNYAGVRADGTNATIIGTQPGEFKADRNNIARVWMDHGTWPYLTTRLYIDQSGDYDLLMEKQSYFRDALIFRASVKDENWSDEKGLTLTCSDGSVYYGTLFEHILVQHLTSFFNVGEHNIIRLEGADWNDTLDMARERGESTAFTAFFGSNLIGLADLITDAGRILGFDKVALFEELALLLDSISGKPDYGSIQYKLDTLKAYLKSVSKDISGKQIQIGIGELAADLRAKGSWIINHIRKNEYLTTKDKNSFFNGYYNNDGLRVDGEYPEGVRMNLTAQVFTTMFGLADETQVEAAYKSCVKYLKDPVTGGYRLNTPLGPNQLNFGRGFAFAYGEKENGSTFSHMAVMYMNALYKRRFVKEAYDIFKSLYTLSNNTNVSRIYPGIPEYFNASGKGLYSYLTGSASWLLMTVLTEMYGIRGKGGNLVIEPKLMAEQFDGNGEAFCRTTFRGKSILVKYSNPDNLEYCRYHIRKASINGSNVEMKTGSKYIELSWPMLESLPEKHLNITVELG